MTITMIMIVIFVVVHHHQHHRSAQSSIKPITIIIPIIIIIIITIIVVLHSLLSACMNTFSASQTLVDTSLVPAWSPSRARSGAPYALLGPPEFPIAPKERSDTYTHLPQLMRTHPSRQVKKVLA